MGEDRMAVSRRRLMSLGAGVIGAAAVTAVPGAQPAQACEGPREGFYERPVDEGAIVPTSRMGIQLYTIGGTIRSLGFAEVFRRLSGMGYTQVEFAGYEGLDPNGISRAELQDLMAEHHLAPAGAHAVGGGDEEAEMEQHINDALELGVPAIGQASLPTTYSADQVDRFNRLGAMCADAGLQFYLHNHSGELQTADASGMTPYERWVAETDPDKVFFELDIYWAYNATVVNPSLDPAQLVADNNERFILYHVKDGHEPGNSGVSTNPLDYFRTPGYSMTHVGQGDIDFETFFNRVRQADIADGMPADGAHRGYMIENDTTSGQDNTKETWVTAVTGLAWMAHGLRVTQ